MNNNINGNANTSVGCCSLLGNTSGFNNTSVGYNSLNQNTSGYSNTSVGFNALSSNNGNSNIAIGYNSFNTDLGSTFSNCTVIGNNTTINTNNTAVLSNNTQTIVCPGSLLIPTSASGATGFINSGLPGPYFYFYPTNNSLGVQYGNTLYTYTPSETALISS